MNDKAKAYFKALPAPKSLEDYIIQTMQMPAGLFNGPSEFREAMIENFINMLSQHFGPAYLSAASDAELERLKALFRAITGGRNGLV